MSLHRYPVHASVAVSDLDRAIRFYEGGLGLTADGAEEGFRIYPCGGDTRLHVYVSPDHAGKGTATLATWYADDLERVVDELTAAGVAFEREGVPEVGSKGIHDAGYVRVAWFKDPDGNTFALEQA